MKRITCFMVLAGVVLAGGCTSSKNATKDEKTHVFILNFPAKQKELIYDRAVKWIVSTTKIEKAVIEYQDRASGTIVSNGTVRYKAEGAWVSGTLYFNMNVDVRSEKARARFANLRYSSLGKTPEPLPEEAAWHRPAQKKCAELVDDLKVFVDKTE
jgi:hypothetical protein